MLATKADLHGGRSPLPRRERSSGKWCSTGIGLGLSRNVRAHRLLLFQFVLCGAAAFFVVVVNDGAVSWKQMMWLVF